MKGPASFFKEALDLGATLLPQRRPCQVNSNRYRCVASRLPSEATVGIGDIHFNPANRRSVLGGTAVRF